LINQLGVEFASALIGFKRAMPKGRHIERVPADQYSARLLVFIEPQQKIREPDDRAATQVVAPSNGLGKGRDTHDAQTSRRRPREAADSQGPHCRGKSPGVELVI
jgi:hypothetical protein